MTRRSIILVACGVLTVLVGIAVAFVTSDRGSVFVYCPLLKRYPPQPVRACEAFVEKP